VKIFLDTSSLFKLYHREIGTEELEEVFSSFKITDIFLSEITKIEFASTVWKKVRMKEITKSEAEKILDSFGSDFEKYIFVNLDSFIVEQARTLVSKYGNEGIRTLDSLQLSVAVTLFRVADVFFTADTLLRSLFELESLPAEIPDR
jgi:uncharacterized protein